MLLGFTLAILTGLTWTLIGVVISRCARANFDMVAYSLAQTGVTAVLTFLVYAVPGRIEWRSLLLLTLLVFSGGLLNSLAQMTVKKAMERGDHGPVWAISQAALVIPFLAGVLLWGHPGNLGQWLGTALIAGGILVPVLGKFHDLRHWLLPTLVAFVLFGLVQTLHAAASQLPACRDTAELRPTLVALGGLTGWEIVRRHQQRRLRWELRTAGLTLAMALLSLASLRMFFLSLDQLSRNGLGNVAMPLIVGSNILGFAFYSLLVLRERPDRRARVGMLGVLAGIVVLAL